MKKSFTNKNLGQTSKKLGSTFVLFMCLILVKAQVTHNVSVMNNFFDPSTLTIDVGDTVVWTNSSGFHNVNGTQDTYPSNPESFGNNTGSDWTFTHIFTAAGTYDYQCDPHVGLGMTGQIIVTQDAMLTINFTGMTPHVGQTLWLAVVDKETGEEIERVKETVEVDFSIEVLGIEDGHSYVIDFYADHNSNGQYDVPPTDHAWRMDLDDVDGDETLDFAHNTNFTDIEWRNLLMIEFSAMNPHEGQDLWLAVIDKETGKEIDRVMKTVEVDFTVDVFGVENGHSYFINFYADHNGNGQYDAPPTDHAWQLEVDDVMGDDTLEFTHNTNFTDVDWKYSLTLQFSNMEPHEGQMLELYLYDTVSAAYVDTITIESISEAAFEIVSYAIMPGTSYNIDFYADLSGNGMYDAPPTDHAWRLELFDVQGDTTISFEHNTEFTDIMDDGTTGITDNQSIEMIQVYPNPASSYILLIGSEYLQGDVEVIIYNINGQVIQSNNFHNIMDKIEIDINTLSRGAYFIKVNTIKDSAMIRFVKVD